MSGENWWFGKGRIGSVVYDESIQQGEDAVLLYVLEANDVRKYLTVEVRKLMSPEKDMNSIEKLTNKYRNWKKFYSSKLKKLKDQAPFSIEEQKREAEQRHKEKLEKMGVEYKGIRTGSSKLHRTTRCYDCKCDLDSYMDLECETCNWILCKCGACGCGYTHST